MKRRDFLSSSLVGAAAVWAGRFPLGSMTGAPRAGTRKILIAGGNYNTPFIRYMAQLTGKPRPKLLLSADRVGRQRQRHHRLVQDLCARSTSSRSVQESFIASTRQTQSWDEVLLWRRRHRLLRRQHAQSAGDLEGAGHRRRPPQGVGSGHRARRRQRGIALLVRGRHDRLASEGAVEGEVSRVPQRQPLARTTTRSRAAGRSIRS